MRRLTSAARELVAKIGAWLRSLRSGRGDRRHPLDPVERRLLIEALDTVLRGDTGAIYVSTPITTGLRLIQWRRSLPSDIGPSHPEYESGRAAVTRANIDHARPVVDKVSAALGGHVIDPTRLGPVSGWGQFDFHEFWADVIRRFVSTVVFVDGWQFSSGCAVEFATAFDRGATLLAEDLRPLTPGDGLTLIAAAIEEMRAVGMDVDALQRAATRVRETARGRALSA